MYESYNYQFRTKTVRRQLFQPSGTHTRHSAVILCKKSLLQLEREAILSQNRWNTHFLISDNVLIKKYSFSWIEHFLVSSRNSNTHFLEKKSGCQPQVQNSSKTLRSRTNWYSNKLIHGVENLSITCNYCIIRVYYPFMCLITTREYAMERQFEPVWWTSEEKKWQYLCPWHHIRYSRELLMQTSAKIFINLLRHA
jgi:hypothetical protein